MHQQHTAFENIVGKGEIARYEQFLLFPQCFLLNQIIVSPFVHVFEVISIFFAELEEPKMRYRVNPLACDPHIQPITTQYRILMHYRYIAVENIVRKRRNKQFPLFSLCFPPCMILIFRFKSSLKCRLQFV